MKHAVLLLLTLSTLGFAQPISPKKIQLFQTNKLEADQSSCDHFPFLSMDLSASPNTFLIAQCEYDIIWKDAAGKPNNNLLKKETGSEPEQLKFSFLDLKLTSSQGEEIKPVGKMTADLRLSLVSNPKYVRIEARENWGAKTIRFTAVFIAKRSEQAFTLEFAGQSSPLKVSQKKLPTPGDFASIEIIGTELFEEKQLESSRLERKIPGAQLKLAATTGKLLAVKIKLSPNAPNVIGAENRYIFRPSDFMLISGGISLRPIGFFGSNFGTDTIYNISRTELKDFVKSSQELSLVFAVGDSFQSGQLRFLNQNKAEVSVKSR